MNGLHCIDVGEDLLGTNAPSFESDLPETLLRDVRVCQRTRELGTVDSSEEQLRTILKECETEFSRVQLALR